MKDTNLKLSFLESLLGSLQSRSDAVIYGATVTTTKTPGEIITGRCTFKDITVNELVFVRPRTKLLLE